jgi:hypothetical protein
VTADIHVVESNAQHSQEKKMSAMRTIRRTVTRSITAAGITAATLAALVSVSAPSVWAAPQPVDPVRVASDSKVWVEGGSTVRSWKCESVDMQTLLGGAGPGPVASLAAIAGLVKEVKLDISVPKLECGNKTMNEHMRKALKAETNPSILFTASRYDVEPASDSTVKINMHGKLTIAGVEKEVVIAAVGTRRADGSLAVVGTHEFLMSAFGVKPPSLMLGTMKVKDNVTVGFNMIVR